MYEYIFKFMKNSKGDKNGIANEKTDKEANVKVKVTKVRIQMHF